MELSHEVKVVRGIPAEWGTCSRTVTLAKTPQALTYWKDTIAAGLQSPDIIILDAITGSQIATLSGHIGWVRSLTFLLDGKSLVSGSEDTTLKLWDVQTGGVIRTFHGHKDYVFSVSTSSDCTTIASGSRDNTIRLWGIQTGECYLVREQHQSVVFVNFSPASPWHLIFVSGGVVQQWDTNSHQITATYEGSHVAFSPNGSHFILSGGKVATVWDSSSGVIVARCPLPNGSLRCCCFSPNGRFVAAAAGTTIYIWDITNSDPYLIETFTGHINDIASLTFSSSSTSLISASRDQSIKFWQIGTLSMDPVASGPGSTSPAIKSITLQEKDGIAISSDLDGVVKTWDLSTGHCKASFQTPAKGSCHRDVQLIDRRLILVWSADKKIYTQDVERDKLLWTADAPQVDVRDIRISGDGSTVFYLDKEWLQAQALWTGSFLGRVRHGLILSQGVLLTADGSRVWVSTKGWNFGNLGQSPTPIPGVLPDRPHLDFVGGVRKYRTSIPGIRNTVTGKEIFQMPARFKTPSDLQWDGQYLVAGYESGEVLILDFNNMLPQ